MAHAGSPASEHGRESSIVSPGVRRDSIIRRDIPAIVQPEGPPGPPAAVMDSQSRMGAPPLATTAAAGPDGSSVPQSMRNSPEPSQRDQQGHYVGPASGVSFLLRIQRKLVQQAHTGSSDSSIFTFGDLPLPEFDQTFVILPPKPEAEAMLRRYFEFAVATHRFLHRPTVESWLEELYETHGTMRDLESARSRIAVVFMVFAHAASYRESADMGDSAAEAAYASARFFSVAEHQLAAEKGKIRLTSVQARLAQCFYLLAHSRLNHCWTLFGITVHLVFALGIHRKGFVDPKSTSVDWVKQECQKRTFWCAFNLSVWLSASLGRPMAFHEEDFDQELPMCVDDSQLFRSGPSPPVPRVQSIMSASVAHLKLSRIIATILREVYGIRPPSLEGLSRLALKYTARLDDWRKDISYLLDHDGDSSFLIPVVVRQRDVLRVAFWHAQMLVYRPFLIKSFASLTNYSTKRDNRPSSRTYDLQQNVQKCLEAAMGVVGLIDRLYSERLMYSTFFFIPYFGFSAAVILYVHAIQQRQSSPDTYLTAFQAAAKCQEQLETTSRQGSLTRRYGVVLQELRHEVLRHNSHLASLYPSEYRDNVQSSHQTSHEVSGAISSLCHPSSQVLVPMAGPTPTAEVNHHEVMDFTSMPGGSPESPIAEMTGWGQFDSLVTGGNGRLDALFSDELAAGWTMGFS
ncbi:fungal-specific transcription factor domain-containing protein [Xylariaceae sp. FL0016]|nr:fungal-specific transcription factor domain-containing protein [Xylariaceae sp. FL0016]